MRLNVFYPLFRHGYPTQKGRCVKTKMLIQSSAVGAGFACPNTQRNGFRASEPRPYELNDSIIHILTHPRFRKKGSFDTFPSSLPAL